MQILRPRAVLFSVLALATSTVTQQTPPRDPQAVAVLQRSLAVMGGTIPADSMATGSVVLEEGSTTEQGTIRILTKGLNQTLEEIETPEGRRRIVYSRGRAFQAEKGHSGELWPELVVSSQGSSFPVAVVGSAFLNPDAAFRYLGLENLDGTQAHHIRFWNTFPSQPGLQHLAEFSTKDIWIDQVSSLPRRLSYFRRAALGSEGPVAIELSYANFQGIDGVLYPCRIEKSLNGTHWATIVIERVFINSGLTDTDFALR